MRRTLERTWFRFGVYMALSALLSIVLFACLEYWSQQQEQEKYLANLPADIRLELTQLLHNHQQHNRRAQDIYSHYGMPSSPNYSNQIWIALGASLFLGGIASYLSARVFVQPLSSVIAAALRIAQGDLTVRAQPIKTQGELADLLRNFNHMADTLERLERERKETVAAISHELRTPLTILQGRLHALCDELIPANKIEFLRLLDHTAHLVRLVEDLHTLSLVEAGRLSLHCTHLELGAFVQEIVPFYVDRAASCGVIIEVSTQAAWIFGDKDRLRQVLANLIDNTLHYAASGGLLQIQVTATTRQAILELSDRGSGLSDGELHWVFNPFFRGGESQFNAKPGSGLGLSIVQSIVQQHGGTIEVFNRAEGGACFRMLFPLLSTQSTTIAS